MSDVFTAGETFGSDHFPVLTTISIKPDANTRGKRSKWIFSDPNWNTFLNNLENNNPYEDDPEQLIDQELAEEVKTFTNNLI